MTDSNAKKIAATIAVLIAEDAEWFARFDFANGLITAESLTEVRDALAQVRRVASAFCGAA